MGGIGSGRRWHYDAKDTTSDYRSIDIRRWHRDGLLKPGGYFSWQWTTHDEKVASISVKTETDRVVLIYRHQSYGEDWEDKNYSVYLDWSDCHLGGKRPWFLCPARGCGRRVALLYGGTIFACRHCYDLAYQSQREDTSDRAARRADKIRARLGWQQGILNPKGWQKPKGMHWKTFQRLNEKHDNYVETSLVGIAAKFNLLGESVDDLL